MRYIEPMTSGSLTGADKLNADVDWDKFDPQEYIHRNYLALHPDDKQILSVVRDHFGDHFRRKPGRVGSGIDVGAGPNLYPAFAMLPWCESITQYEWSAANVAHLRREIPGYAATWDPFWDVLCEGEGGEGYAALGPDPRERFRQTVTVRSGNLYDLGRPGPDGETERWAMGTMFFVAESITESREEFADGVACFMNALEPGAPFAAAFMENSRGYPVGGEDFPASYVGAVEIRNLLKGFASDVDPMHLGKPDDLRDGYTGMILACGHRND
ncbi:SCO2525 family SAM-dependent methyltransferase [Streptomyces sp. NPDC059766]|uniref:SCO2525 family SAM-dependent methyltransferase n=1 Tax=Streptomyces sp. NPDC059766 TaxID=3346940 RepID=UPI00364E7B85